MNAIVETWHVHGLGHATLQGLLGSVHALSNRTCGVECVAETLQADADLSAYLAVLLRNFVADRPHHDGGVVAVGLHQIGDVLLGPLVEETGIAVLAFGVLPHVETLGHHHHA